MLSGACTLDKSYKKTDVYFNQRLGAAHSKHLLKYIFSMVFMQKSRKKEEKAKKLMQKN